MNRSRMYLCGMSMLVLLAAGQAFGATGLSSYNVGAYQEQQLLQLGHNVDPNAYCRVLVVAVSAFDNDDNDNLVLFDWVTWQVGSQVQNAHLVDWYFHDNGNITNYMYCIVNPIPGNGVVSAHSQAPGTDMAGMMAFTYYNARQSLPAIHNSFFTHHYWEVPPCDPHELRHITGMTPDSMLAYFAVARSQSGNWEPYDHHSRWLETELHEFSANQCRYSGGYAYVTGTEWWLELAYDGGGSDKLLTCAAIDPVLAPTLQLNGANPLDLECHTPYSEPGYYATDGWGNDITTHSVVVTNNVNPDVPGDYTVQYQVPVGSTVTQTRTVRVRDNTPPTVSITDPASKTLALQCGVGYDIQGNVAYNAFDLCDNGVDNGSVTINWDGLNPWMPAVGTYNVVYEAQDAAGNTGSDTLTVVVSDDQAPTISVNPPAETVECGPYTEAMARTGVTCSDVCDDDTTLTAGLLVTVAGGHTFPLTGLGEYTIYYNKTDASGNPAPQAQRTVTLADTLPPEIVDTGETEPVVECPEEYTLAQALTHVSANDACQGDLTADIVVEAFTQPEDLPTTFPISAVGEYEIRYNVSDASGNAATQTTRTLTVQDTLPAVWTIPSNIAITSGDTPFTETWAMEGVHAVDACAGELPVTLEVIELNAGPVSLPLEDPGVPYPRIYSLVYTADDGNGNVTVNEWRSLFISSEYPLGITILGGNPVTVGCKEPYGQAEDVGAVAFDPTFGDYTDQMNTSGLPVDTTEVGTHYVSYSVTINGTYYEDTRSVHVVDDDAPAITLNRGAHLQIGVGSTYVDPGAVATDPCEGNLTGDIVLSGDTVDTSQPVGSLFEVHYDVSDSSGNPAPTRTRTIELVPDSNPPELTLEGPAEVHVSCGAGFEEPGYSAWDAVEGDLTEQVVVDPLLDLYAPPATYVVTYTVSDFMGHEAQAQRTVVVEDDCPLHVDYVGEVDEPGVMHRTIQSGEDYAFAVEVTGAVGETAYQWLYDNGAKVWTVLAEAPDAPAFTLAGLQPGDAGHYKCVVSDAVTSVESPVLTLEVDTGVPLHTVAALTLAALLAAAGTAWLSRRSAAG